jgi:tetratricopeptide (TPR) repeat protein
MISTLASKRSLILVLEHLHLADDTVCDVIEKVLSGNQPPHALFVTTVRPEEVEPNSRVASFLEFTASLHNMQTIELKPFSVDETREFIQQHLDPPPSWLARQIHHECGGIPLFVSEMVDHIHRTLPERAPSLRESVHHRISSLESTDRDVLTTLALSPEPLLIPTITEACSFNTEAVYAALQRLGRARLAELATAPDGNAIALPCHDRLLELFRAELEESEQIDWNARLARAHETNRGPAMLIERHWTQAGQAEKALVYADKESSRALVDGDHARVAEMVGLALRQSKTSDERARHTIQLADSLTRTGRFHEAAQVLASLDEIDAETAQRWRGRRCQLYLMAGDLSSFEASVGPLPVRAKVPLADLLAPYHPARAEGLLADAEDDWAELVKIRILTQYNDDRQIQAARRKLEECLAKGPEASPEWETAAALTEAETLCALGDLDAAQQALEKGLAAIEPDPGNLTWMRLRLARARCALNRGQITQARSAARMLLLEARERKLPGLRVTACELLARVHLIAGEPNAARPLTREALEEWPSDLSSITTVRLKLLEATLSFYTESHRKAAELLDILAADETLDGLNTLRPVQRDAVILRARVTCMQLLSAWHRGATVPADVVNQSHRALTRVRPRAGWWIGIQAALQGLVNGSPDEAAETLKELLERSTPSDRVVEALAWGLLANCQDQLKRGSTRSRNQAKSILDEIGAAPPPELVLLEARARAADQPVDV